MIFAQHTTAFYIPTITYIYNDEELMNQSEFPTLISLIFTKKDEGRMISKFLEKMDYRFMDIWYHQLSQKVAEYISEEYLTKFNGCGRVQEMTKKKDMNEILVEDVYNKTEKSSAVQLILQNVNGLATGWLQSVTGDRGFRNKIYVTGTSNGRERYHEQYKEILGKFNGSDDSVIFPLLALSNIQLKGLNKDLADPWVEERGNGTLDNLYRQGQSMRKVQCEGGCLTTSWTPHVVAGTKIIGLALQEVLEKNGGGLSMTKLRKRIFRVIVNETREIDLDLDEDISLKVRFKRRTLSSATVLKVYRRKTNEYHVLGEISPESVHVTNQTLLREISHYEKRCSPDCLPGSYLTSGTLQSRTKLSCCWKCKACPPNHFSNTTNQNHCYTCEKSEKSAVPGTGCIAVDTVYINAGSDVHIVGLTLTVVGMTLVAVIAILVWKNEDRPVVKASDPGYMYTLLLSIAIGFLGSFMPLFKPTQSVCTMEYVIVVISATLITTNLLWKCIKIHAIFAAANSFQRPKFEIALKQAGQVFLNGFSLAIVAIFLLIDRFGSGPGWTFQNYQENDHGPLYPQCHLNEGYRGAIGVFPAVLPLAYFLVTLVFVFKMRKFSHNFRETLNILAAVLIVAFCCVMFLSGYNVSPPETKALLRAVVLFVINLAFLSCLFLPKVVIIFKKVDTKEEKRLIADSVHSFATKASRRVSTCKPSPNTTPISSPKLGGRISVVSSSPNATPSTMTQGRTSLTMAQAGGRSVPTQKRPSLREQNIASIFFKQFLNNF